MPAISISFDSCQRHPAKKAIRKQRRPLLVADFVDSMIAERLASRAGMTALFKANYLRLRSQAFDFDF